MTLYFPENGLSRELQFNFFSNSIISGRGFYIEYLQELCIGNSEQKYQTGMGHTYPSSGDGKSSDDRTANQARSMESLMPQSNANDDSIQQTIALREQKASVYKKATPTYPSNYVARSNPVGEMIEAIDRDNNQMNNHQSTNNSKNNPSSLNNNNNNNNLNYPTTYSTQMHQSKSQSSPLFDGRKSQTHGRQDDSIEENNRKNKQLNFNSKPDQNNNDQSKWSGNIHLLKPTVAGNTAASFLNKLKMGDQVTTNIKGRYEVIENNSKKVKRQII